MDALKRLNTRLQRLQRIRLKSTPSGSSESESLEDLLSEEPRKTNEKQHLNSPDLIVSTGRTSVITHCSSTQRPSKSVATVVEKPLTVPTIVVGSHRKRRRKSRKTSKFNITAIEFAVGRY
ncbi:hypothetical protein KIN20_023993 [Parelaphostrongylus tenuis]|uniref:Uncharacterized protein n=1 Tax=Parelaphostrongylus tenuis TaxID=148309 RepID=A0AAD5NAK8_PARTN|nr:hypothetical protein KIN20_023993 [Parelaphostrongylus tenuis]